MKRLYVVSRKVGYEVSRTGLTVGGDVITMYDRWVSLVGMETPGLFCWSLAKLKTLRSLKERQEAIERFRYQSLKRSTPLATGSRPRSRL